ncbi:hypothetical protein EXS70_04120 [Candidatus Peribacteria bacterium]|nr:hypothetical protein [Candidatus Peribacteria bacterium]
MKYFNIFIVMASLFLGGCWLVDGSQFVLTDPQSVIPLTKPIGTIDTLVINGKEWHIEKNKTDVTLGDPQKNLAGVSGVAFQATSKNNGNEIRFSLGIHIPQINTMLPLEAGATLAIDDLTHESLNAEVTYTTDFREECPQGNGIEYNGEDKSPTIFLIPREPIILIQSTKHITLKGTFDLPPTPIPRYPYMICDWTVDDKGFQQPTSPLYRNPAPPAIIEARGIHIDIDTDLIFRWCDKGANCYEK